MFFAAEMKLIREICLNEYESLLNLLGMPKPNWIGDEYRIYEKLDAQLTNRICSLMKSESIIDGYIKLLELGGIEFTYAETDKEILSKIVKNKNKIIQSVRNIESKYQSWKDQTSQSPKSETIEKIRVDIGDFGVDSYGIIKTLEDIESDVGGILFASLLGEKKSSLRRKIRSAIDAIKSQKIVQFRSKTSCDLENLESEIRNRMKDFHDGETDSLGLRITKAVERHERSIPLAWDFESLKLSSDMKDRFHLLQQDPIYQFKKSRKC